jgi:hypothetical protein
MSINIRNVIKITCAKSDYRDVLNNLKNVQCPYKLFDRCEDQMYWYLTCEYDIQRNAYSQNLVITFVVFIFIILFFACREKNETRILM